MEDRATFGPMFLPENRPLKLRHGAALYLSQGKVALESYDFVTLASMAGGRGRLAFLVNTRGR